MSFSTTKNEVTMFRHSTFISFLLHVIYFPFSLFVWFPPTILLFIFTCFSSVLSLGKLHFLQSGIICYVHSSILMSVHQILSHAVWYLFCFFLGYVDPCCNKRCNLSRYLTNLMHKIRFTISFISCL